MQRTVVLSILSLAVIVATQTASKQLVADGGGWPPFVPPGGHLSLPNNIQSTLIADGGGWPPTSPNGGGHLVLSADGGGWPPTNPGGHLTSSADQQNDLVADGGGWPPTNPGGHLTKSIDGGGWPPTIA